MKVDSFANEAGKIDITGYCGLALKKCLLEFLSENSGGRESAASQRTDDDSCCFLNDMFNQQRLTLAPALLPQLPPSRNLPPRLRVSCEEEAKNFSKSEAE